MRKRVPILIGGVALVVASQYLNFGVGFQEGGQVDESTDEVAEVVDVAELQPTDDEPSPSVSSPPTAETELPMVADVLIVEDRYMVVTDASNPDDRQPMSVDEIVTMTGQVIGEANGIRVRIARSPTAFAITEAGLMRALEQANVSPDQIDARRQLVP